MTETREAWPALPLESWQATKDTVHMYTQVVGKVRMTLMPKMNQTWHVPLYVSTRGLTTGPMPVGLRVLEIEFDFHAHTLRFSTCEGEERSFPLGGTVAAFYQRVMDTLKALNVEVAIWPVPVEVENPIRFDQDTQHATYDPEAMHRFWKVLYQVDNVFKIHRARFTGKSSPVHFFWGSFDLALTRFSGELAPPGPGMTGFMAESYNAELISVGFWPGGDWPGVGPIPSPMFYAYTFPQPEGMDTAKLRPAAAHWHPQLREFVLFYDEVRNAADPVQAILDFAQSTYEAGATLSKWPVQKFELVSPV
jgi:hypothetical protein